MLRVGVVGVGNMGFHHARIYSELTKEGKVELIGVADVNFDRAKEVAKKFNTVAFRNYKELIGSVDAVSVAVPTHLHSSVSIEFLKAGVSVLVEKPIADSVEKAREMIREAEKSRAILMVGHVERFNPAVLKLKEIISSGEIGDIITMSAKRVGPFDPRVLETSVIVDLAVHDIDVMRFLYDSDIKEIYASSKTILGATDDYAILFMKFEGCDGVIETNRLTPRKIRTLNVVGSKGVIWLDYIAQDLILAKNDHTERIEVQKREPLRVEIEHFIECIEKGSTPVTDGESGLYALKVALKAVESSRRGEVLKI